MTTTPRISVIGLGYVGLPLAIALAAHFEVVGYDRDADRLAELGRGRDDTREVNGDILKRARLTLTDDAAAMVGSDLFILAVPTPVDAANKPDLSILLDACTAVGEVMKTGAVVVLESTVYPGVTEDVCGPALAAASGLRAGIDFHLGYSPERVNPGDRAHGLSSITKIIAAQSPQVIALLERIYGPITGGNLFVAKDIRTAEAAKVIENTQRDINVAFVNEISMIFDKMGISTVDVLAAARTKWNFLDFRPGLVGGHCIGVDPYYLALAADNVGHRSDIILSGRRINEEMADYVARRVIEQLDADASPWRVLVLGLTFKENVPDLRNTKVADLAKALTAAGAEVVICDPLADAAKARHLFGVDIVASIAGLASFDAVIGAVAHDEFRDLSRADIVRLVKPGGLVAEVKEIWPASVIPDELRRWTL
ncbi:MAG: nucleotide sugar dehydrogenase [Alphaproteobacteria bacterium]|nr:nucleotide sugar dehydrogenase [Alphaproteobacteria bacterium]